MEIILIDSRVPQITSSPQPHTITPLDGYPSCLVDDPVYLVDSSLVLVGSQTTPIGDIKLSITSNAPTTTTYIPTMRLNTKSNAPHNTTRILR